LAKSEGFESEGAGAAKPKGKKTPAKKKKGVPVGKSHIRTYDDSSKRKEKPGM